MRIGFVLLAASAAAEPFVNAHPAGPTTETLTRTDIDVITVAAHYLMTHEFLRAREAKGQFMAIQAEAAAGETKNALFLPHEFMEKVTTGTMLADLLERNRRIYLLRKPFTREDVLFVGSKTVHEWIVRKTVDKEVPIPKGFVYIWLPGYSPDNQKAMIYVYNTGSDPMGLDMWGEFLYLERQKGKWKVVKTKEAWRT